MKCPDVEKARDYALQRLERELAPSLVYHSLEHTRDEVAPAAQRLAAMEGIDGEELILLVTAALYHDIGFVKRRQDHERASIAIAEEALPSFGYSPSQIRAIGQLILATARPQESATLLEQILVDADLDVLGTEAYRLRSLDLRREIEALGSASSDEEWYRGQLKLLQTHRYLTAAARTLRDAGKLRNLELVKAQLEAVPS